MIGQSLANDTAQACVVVWSGGISVVRSPSKPWMIPELYTSQPELLFTQRFEANHVVFVRHLVHLGMDEKLIRVAFYCDTLVAHEVCTSIFALTTAVVVRADPTMLTIAVTVVVIRIIRACMRRCLRGRTIACIG
jgi:hypothetical protein